MQVIMTPWAVDWIIHWVHANASEHESHDSGFMELTPDVACSTAKTDYRAGADSLIDSDVVGRCIG